MSASPGITQSQRKFSQRGLRAGRAIKASTQVLAPVIAVASQRQSAPDSRPRRPAQPASRVVIWRNRSQKWGWLMAAAQRGEERAYKQLLHELDAWLRGYYAQRLPGPEAEDARQEALLAIHSERDAYLPCKPFGPWVAAIARYKWIDQLRSSARFAARSLDDEIAKERDGQRTKSAVAVEDHGEAAISSVALDRLLKQLTPAQVTVIRLVKLQGLSIEGASHATGQSVPLVKVNIHRGLRKLAELVGRDSAAPRASSSAAAQSSCGGRNGDRTRSCTNGRSLIERSGCKCGQQ